MKKLFISIFTSILVCLPLAASAWTPEKTVNIVVPYPVGGTPDAIGRIMAKGLEKQGVNTIVLNKTGANGVIGTNYVAKSAPDGYTMVMFSSGLMFSQLIKTPGAEYEIVEDFTHLVGIGTTENYVFANPKNVSGDMKEVLNDTRLGKKKYRWAVTWPGAEFAAHRIATAINTDIDIITYPATGAPAAITDLVGGSTDLMLGVNTPALTQFVKEGRLKLMADLEPKKNSAIAIEHNLPGLVAFSFYGMSMPKNTPQPIEDFYRSAFMKALNDPEIISQFNAIGIKVSPTTNFRELIKSQYSVYAPVASKIKTNSK